MTDSQREVLESLARSRTAPQREVTRAKALLLAADGVATTAIAGGLGVSPASVTAWRERFAADGLAKFARVREGRGRKPSIGAEKVAAIVHATLHDKPPGETHWSSRSMARSQGVSPATVQRIWSARGLQPHRVETFKLSNDKRFEEKLTDVVGLYLNPPDKAVVLCMDEKSQIQALDRTQPTLPMKPWAGRHHDPRLQAQRHHHPVRRPRRAHRQGHRPVPAQAQEHRVPALPAPHRPRGSQGPGNSPDPGQLRDAQAPNVVAWLDKHPRFHLHFTPTSSSWLNLVERWFRNLTDKAIRRGVFKSVPDLIAAIEDYLQANNDNPRPFEWTATAEDILQKIRRGRVTLEQITT